MKQQLRTGIFFKSLVSYALLLLLNMSLSIIIILYNQSSLVGKVEVQDKYLENMKFIQFLKNQADGLKFSGDEKEVIIQLFKKFAGSGKTANSELSLFDNMGHLLVKVKHNGTSDVGENRDGSLLNDKRMALKLIFKYRIDKTGSLYNIESGKFLDSYMIFHPRKNIYVLKTVQELNEMDRLSGILMLQVLVVFLISLIIHSIFTYIIYRNIIHPLKRLNQLSRKVMLGDFNHKINYSSDDEIGELSNSFNEMTMAVNNLRNEALDSNPLTGLPGNNVIMRTINDWLEKGTLFALAYIDLDNFKPFNDKFGFETGDRAISLLSDILKDIQEADPGVFIGHTGGDDFVFLSDFEIYENVGSRIIEEFVRRSKSLYSPDIISSGYYVSRTRSGEIRKFNLLSITIGVVTNSTRKFESYSEIIQEVTKMKKYAKSFDGNTIKTDQRDI